MALRTIVPLLLVAPLLALFPSLWASRAASRRSLGSPPPWASVRRAGSSRSTKRTAGRSPPARPRAERAASSLDRALGAQRAFIADAAHELRTPLTR
jgi:two-component system OmpR family sensor kinase